MENNKAVGEVQWAMNEAYKIAVHQCGISDWSEYQDFNVPEGNFASACLRKVTNPRKQDVERMQIEIAKMILTSLHTK